MQNHSFLTGYLFAIAATAIWAGNFIIARDIIDSVPPVSLAFWRWVVAVVVFLPFALKSLLRERHILKKHIPYLLATAVLGITVFNTLIYIAGHTTTAMNLSLIAITFPVFVIIFTRLLYGELITFRKATGILLVVTGMIFLITKGHFNELLNIQFAIGDIWMLLAAVIFAIYSILLKHKPQELSIWALHLSTFILGLLFLLPFYIWETLNTPAIAVTPQTVFSIVYIGVFASIVAFIFWNKAIIHVGPAKAGMIYYSLPLFSGIVAYFYLNEAITSVHLFSAIFIIAGIVTANYNSKKPQSINT